MLHDFIHMTFLQNHKCNGCQGLRLGEGEDHQRACLRTSEVNGIVLYLNCGGCHVHIYICVYNLSNMDITKYV